MRIDIYTRITLGIIAVALAVIALGPWLRTLGLPTAEAQSMAAKYEVTVPKSWGKLLTVSGSGDLILEDGNGVLRQVEVQGKAPEYPKVQVQVNRQ